MFLSHLFGKVCRNAYICAHSNFKGLRHSICQNTLSTLNTCEVDYFGIPLDSLERQWKFCILVEHSQGLGLNQHFMYYYYCISSIIINVYGISSILTQGTLKSLIFFGCNWRGGGYFSIKLPSSFFQYYIKRRPLPLQKPTYCPSPVLMYLPAQFLPSASPR